MAEGDGLNRYARQMMLPEIGAYGQAKFAAAHVLIVGLGGLGVPVLQYLVGAGVGRLTLVDPDHVEQSNLHRQPIYGAHLGAPKVEAAAAFARTLNADVRIDARVESLSPANAPALVEAADIVLDCADSFAASYILSDTCMAQGKPLISASALGLSGYVGGFCGGAPSLRAIFPDLPETLATCATAGVLGPVVGMLGTLQAQMALACLAGITPSPLGHLMRYEMKGFRASSFRFDGAPEPDEAAHRFIAKAEITPDDFVVELRGEEEAPQPVHPAARRMEVGGIGEGDLPRDGQRAVLACRSGLRAWRAANRLREKFGGEIVLVADQ
jgi:molybdopterin/thiamine biosynthesis adenylyltransferase